jgi:hypothetical protein
MQAVEEVEKHVPVREGDYGEKVATVEPGGVEYIALRERHGKPIQLFWTWLSPNLEFATVFIGVIGRQLRPSSLAPPSAPSRTRSCPRGVPSSEFR